MTFVEFYAEKGKLVGAVPKNEVVGVVLDNEECKEKEEYPLVDFFARAAFGESYKEDE